MKLITLLIGLSFIITNSFANCDEEYKQASKQRTNIKTAVIATAAVGTFIAFPVMTPLGATTFVLTYGTAAGLTHMQNNFDKVLSATVAARQNRLNKDLNDIAKKVASHLKLTSKEVLPKVINLLEEADQKETFCPVVKIKRDGQEVRAVFNRASVIRYLEQSLKSI